MSNQTVINWLEEADDELSDAESIISDHVSESELEISEVSEDEIDISENDFNKSVEQNVCSSNFVYGKNRYKWSLQPFPQRRTRSSGCCWLCKNNH